MSDSVVRVLVVDDDRAIRETLRAALEEEGYVVAEAANGALALDILRGTPSPSVVLLDLRMPVLDGAQVLKAVAADERLATRHAYAIITANREMVPGALAATHGRLTVPVIPKPFELDDVLDLVASAAVGLGSSGAGAFENAQGAIC
jgi:CheY-like chemotaxis protein